MDNIKQEEIIKIKKKKCEILNCECYCHIKKRNKIIKKLKQPVEPVEVIIKKAGIIKFDD